MPILNSDLAKDCDIIVKMILVWKSLRVYEDGGGYFNKVS